MKNVPYSLQKSHRNAEQSAVYQAIPQIDKELTFHVWPKKGITKTKVINFFGYEDIVDCHLEWMRLFKMGKPHSKCMKVCSRHFVREDYYFVG